MRLCRSAGGYTLIESLIALAVLMALAALFPLWMHTIDHREKETGPARMEVELFFQEMGLKIRESVDLAVTKEGLILEKYGGEKLLIEQNDANVRKRVVGKNGQTLLLQNVRDLHFELLGKGVKIVVTGRKGETYERIFFPFAPQTQ